MNCPQCDMYTAPGTLVCDCGHKFNSSEYEEINAKSKVKLSSKNPFFGLFGLKKRLAVKIVLLSALILFGITYFLKDSLPRKNKIFKELYREPLQTQTNIPPAFEVEQKGFNYTVTPLYNYELYGLIVSYHHSDSFLDTSHQRWNDYLNIKDICVIWGKNIRTEVYRHMKFWNRDFICNYRYPSSEVGMLFSENCLSNNHLLTDKKEIRKKIMSAREGDQIYLKGYLSAYAHKKSEFKRGTSTTRQDRGDGACETIYVTDFKILSRTNVLSRFLHSFSIYLFIFCLILLLIDLHRTMAASESQ